MARSCPHAERLASIEAAFDAHTAQDAREFATIATTMATQTQALAEINRKLDKQKGFIGGVVFIVSAVWAVAVFVVKMKFGG